MPIDTRDPENDISTAGTWSGTAGNRYLLVNDFPDASSNFLLHGTTAGNILFGYSAFSIPSNATDIVVRVKYYDQDATSGNNNLGSQIRVNSLSYPSATHNPTTTTTLVVDEWLTNPNTGTDWTPTVINGSGTTGLNAFGLRSTDANPQIRIYSVQIEIEYTTPAGGRSFGFIIG
jgi:hypothetical protein